MLLLSKSNPRVTTPRPVAAGVSTLEEGLALNGVMESGVLKVKPSVGAANTEAFAGFALNERTAPALMPLVLENQTVVLLEAGIWGIRIPKAISGTPQVRYASNNTALPDWAVTNAGVLDAGEYKVATLTDGGNSIQVVAADLGKKLNVIYSYVPTIQDLLYLGGDNSPVTFSTITSVLNVTGVIEQGVVYTSNFDVSIDWANWAPATGLKAGANGVVKTTGNGATINGRVVEAPSQDFPFLGIDFTVAS